MSRPIRIGVIGGGGRDGGGRDETGGGLRSEPGDEVGAESGADPTSEPLALAREVGRRIAEAGAILVCGGLRGVMQAAAEAAAAAGGWTVGLLPGDDAGAANPGIRIPIPTGMGEARNVLVVRASEAVIAIGGGWGTLSEAGFCLKLGVPLIRLASDLPELPVPEASDPAEAVAWALEQAERRRSGGRPVDPR